MPSDISIKTLARAEEYGIDLSQLRERLKWTPTERIERRQAALALAEALRHLEDSHHPLDAPRLLTALSATDVAFIVVGGMAAVVQGSAYITADLDTCYRRTDVRHREFPVFTL
jgi:hypothetical protein